MSDVYKLQYNGMTLAYPGWNGYVGYEQTPDPMEFIDKYYPVGTYYSTTVENFDPNVSFVGTWVKDTDGRVLRSDTENALGTGGEITHAITVAEMPQHNHRTTRQLMHAGKVSTGTRGNDTFTGRIYDWTYVYNYGATKPYNYGNRTSSSATNTSTSHNNVQKSMICYRWHRTA